MSKNAVINIKFAADLNDFSKEIDVAYAKMRRMSDGLQNLGKAMTLSLTLPISLMGVAAIKSFAEIEKLQLGLQNVMGDAGAAANEYQKLLQTAKMPGIGLKEAVDGSIRLQTIGFSADQARVALSGLANAVASVGKGKFELDRAVYGLEQLANTEHPLQQDINILRNAIPQTVPILKKAFSEIKNVNAETLSAAGITSKQVVDALIKGYSELPKFAGGIQNAFDNIADSYLKASATFGEAINKNINITNTFNGIGDAMVSLAEKFKNLDPTIQTFILSFAAILAISGPLIFAIGSIGKALIFFGATTATILPVIAAITGLAAIITLASQETESWYNKTEMLSKTAEDAEIAVNNETRSFRNLYESLKDTTIPQSQRNKLLNEFNNIAGTSISFINGEAYAQNQLKIAYEKTSEAMANRAKYNFYVEEEIKAEAELIKVKKKAGRELEKAHDLYKDVTETFLGIPLKPLSMSYLYLTGQSPNDVYAAGLQAVGDVSYWLNEIRKQKEKYKPKPQDISNFTSAPTAEELKNQQDELKKHQALVFKAQETFGYKSLNEYMKIQEERINREWDGLTAFEKKKYNYQDYVQRELAKSKDEYLSKLFIYDQNYFSKISDEQKAAVDEEVKLSYEKSNKLLLAAKQKYDGSLAGEYTYNKEIEKINADALQDEINIRKKYLQDVTDLENKQQDNRISIIQKSNDLQHDLQQKYHNLAERLAELSLVKQTDLVVKQKEEIQRKITELLKFAAENGVIIKLETETSKLTEMQIQLKQNLDTMFNMVTSWATDTVVLIANAFADLVTGYNKDPFKDFGLVILKSLGDLMVKLGTLFFTFGKLGEAFKNYVGSLQFAEAAGIGLAMIAVGATISAVAKKGMQSSTSSNPTVSTSGGYMGAQNQDEYVLYSRLDGRDLVLSNQRSTYIKRR